MDFRTFNILLLHSNNFPSLKASRFYFGNVFHFIFVFPFKIKPWFFFSLFFLSFYFSPRQGKEKAFGVTLQYCVVIWVSLMTKVLNDAKTLGFVCSHYYYLSQATQILKILLL